MQKIVRKSALILMVAALLGACEGNTESGEIYITPQRPETLPPEFESYRDVIESSKRSFIRVEPALVKNTPALSSKFRGVPYLPEGESLPVDKNGEPLTLLAQINFTEVPNLSPFPEAGILQFFIQAGQNAEHVWGMNMYQGEPWEPAEYFESLQQPDYFKVVYYPPSEVVAVAEGRAVKPHAGYDLPILDEMALDFSLAEETINVEDYQFEQYFGADRYAFYDKHENLDWEKLDLLYQYLKEPITAKIGGYGRFVQEDPRFSAPEDEEWLVLLCIESGPVGDSEIMWGDAGVGTFLIRSRDLERLDFSNVIYYWDNH